MTSVEKRNKILLISLICISALTGFYYWFSGRPHSLVDASRFQVTDLELIDRVILQREGNQVELNFDGVRWNVNGEQADRNMIDILFATLQQAQPARPVAKTITDTISNQLKVHGTTVALLSEGKTELTFLTGGNTRKTQSYFLKAGETTPYIMSIPGYRVYVSGIFELDKNGWKDKMAFQLNWRNFQSLTASFPESSKENFDIKFIDKFFTIEGMTSVDTTRLNDFLDAVSFLTVDSYLDNPNQLDSLSKATPDMIIHISDVASKEYTLRLYGQSKSSGVVHGVINGSQLAYFDQRKLDAIVKPRRFFEGTP